MNDHPSLADTRTAKQNRAVGTPNRVIADAWGPGGCSGTQGHQETHVPSGAPPAALAHPTDLIHEHFGYSGWLARGQFSKPVVVSFMGDDLLGTPHAEGRLRAFSKVAVQVNRYVARTVDAVIVKSAEMAEVVRPVKAHIIMRLGTISIFGGPHT